MSFDKVDNNLGKGEVESSILSGSTTPKPLENNENQEQPTMAVSPDIHGFGRNLGRTVFDAAALPFIAVLADRPFEMIVRRDQGWPYARIARRYGVSSVRVQQILAKAIRQYRMHGDHEARQVENLKAVSPRNTPYVWAALTALSQTGVCHGR